MNLRPRVGITLGEVVTASGIEWSKAHRLLTALGLSTDPDVSTTAGEADAVHLIALASNDRLGEEATMQLARGAHSPSPRLPRRDAGTRYVEVVKDYADMALSVRQLTEVLMDFDNRTADVWRAETARS